MDKLIPVLVSKRNSSYTAHVISSPQIQSANYSEWKALHAIQESFDKTVVDLICMDENTTDELNQMFYAPVCHVDCFRVQTAIHSRSCDIWLPIVYWSEGDSHCLSCPILEQFLYMYKENELSAETVEYYFQCWLRKASNSLSKEEFSQKLEFLAKQFSEKHNYYIRLVNVAFHDKLYYRWSRSRLPRRKVSATKELETIAESIVYHPNSYDELVHSSDYKFVRIPANDKLNDFYNRIYRALMDERHRKGVLIVGQELTGRSFAIETVLRTIQRDINYKPNSNNIWVRRNDNNYVSKVWKLSGSGLISGMASVGQWEARTEAIFSYAAANDLILYFESLLKLKDLGIDGPDAVAKLRALRDSDRDNPAWAQFAFELDPRIRRMRNYMEVRDSLRLPAYRNSLRTHLYEADYALKQLRVLRTLVNPAKFSPAELKQYRENFDLFEVQLRLSRWLLAGTGAGKSNLPDNLDDPGVADREKALYLARKYEQSSCEDFWLARRFIAETLCSQDSLFNHI